MSVERTRIFTVAWSWCYIHGAPVADEFQFHGRGECHCRVVIWSEAHNHGSPVSDASTFANHEVEVFSDVIALRSHNSLSLPEDGRYRLSLTDCHGYIGGGPISAASEGGLEHETFGASKLSFVALPESLEFDVNGQPPATGITIGNFHLLPAVQVVASPAASNAEPVQDNLKPSISNSSSETQRINQAYIVGHHGGHVPLVFFAGAVVGIVVCLLVGWLAMSRVGGRGRGELTWRAVVQCWTNFVRPGIRTNEVPGELLTKKDELPGTDDSSIGDISYDSDTVAIGDTPDRPLGLPRNDEDWRALFDTLYQEEQEEAAALETRGASNEGSVHHVISGTCTTLHRDPPSSSSPKRPPDVSVEHGEGA